MTAHAVRPIRGEILANSAASFKCFIQQLLGSADALLMVLLAACAGHISFPRCVGPTRLSRERSDLSAARSLTGSAARAGSSLQRTLT